MMRALASAPNCPESRDLPVLANRQTTGRDAKTASRMPLPGPFSVPIRPPRERSCSRSGRGGNGIAPSASCQGTIPSPNLLLAKPPSRYLRGRSGTGGWRMRQLELGRSPVLLAAAIVIGGGTNAADWSPSPIEPGRYKVKQVVHPLAPESITQNVDPNTIVAGTSVACVGRGGVTTDNGWWRLYDISAFSDFCMENVDFGIETAVGPTQNITVNVFCLDNGLPFLGEFLDLAGTNSQPQPDADLEFFNIPVAGCCDTQTQQMAVELLSDNCQETGTCQLLFIGCNDLGQTAPSYITADDCGVIDPIDMALIGFPDSHVIQVVNGVHGDDFPDGGDGGTGDDGGVPATTAQGAMLTVLLLLGTSALLLRRRAATQ